MDAFELNLHNKQKLHRSDEGIYFLSEAGGIPLTTDQEGAIEVLVDAVKDLGYWCQVAKDILPEEWFSEINRAVKHSALENVKVFELNESDGVAAETLEQAKEWYLETTGLNEEDAFYDHEAVEMSLDKEVWEDETKNKKQTLQEIIEESWEGKPFLAFSREY